jgi:hypothetical protein
MLRCSIFHVAKVISSTVSGLTDGTDVAARWLLFVAEQAEQVKTTSAIIERFFNILVSVQAWLFSVINAIYTQRYANTIVCVASTCISLIKCLYALNVRR